MRNSENLRCFVSSLLVGNLEKQEEIYEVVICEEDLVGDIQAFMDEKVPQSQLLIFMGTQNAIESEAYRHELALALMHGKEIIPIKGMDIEWDGLNHIDLTQEGQGYFDLGDKKGFPFNDENFDGFCNELYEYILQYKREVNLFEPNKARIDKQRVNFKKIIENFAESEEFLKTLEENIIQFEDIFQKLSKNQISTSDYFLKCAQLISKNSKSVIRN